MSGLWCWLLLLSLCLNGTLSEREEWCESDHDHTHAEEGLPHKEDFLLALFDRYGDNTTCRILEEGFEDLLSDLSIGEASSHSEEDGHDHRRKKRSNQHHSHIRQKRDVGTTCYGAEDLLDIYNISHEEGMSQSQFENMSPALIQQIVQGCVEEEHEEEESSITLAQTWGFGFLSVVIVSACSVIGLIMARWQEKPAFKYIMAVMLALGMSTLVADALIHLVPHGLGLHSHAGGHDHHEDEGIVVEEFVWKTLLACLMIWLFFNIQVILQALVKKPTVEGDNKQAPSHYGMTTSSDKEAGSVNDLHNVSSKDKLQLADDEKPLAPTSLGWMIAIGDGVHNFADGLAIGASYTISWQVGLATTIAMFCHELAHEFGDIAAMLSVGWSWKRVLVMQLLSQCPAFIGLFIGIPIAANADSAEQWILLLASGMFLFVALCDIVPELMEFAKVYNRWYILIAANCGIALGYFLMVLIAVFEEHIKV